MADIMNGRYALADPSSGLTVLSLDGGELNMFGSCTRIRTTRHPETWGKASGGPKQINNTAMQHIDNILNAPGNFGVTTVGNLQFLEKRLPDGRGLRLNMDGTFKGFID